MTIAAQFFTSVLPILILVATWRNARDTSRLADVLGLPEESRAVLEDAVQGSNGATFGVIGTLMVLVSATKSSYSFMWAFVAAWELRTPKPTLGIGVAVAGGSGRAGSRPGGRARPGRARRRPAARPRLGGRRHRGLRHHLGAPGAVGVALRLAPWPRLLLPGARRYALVMVAFRPASAAWLPRALDASVERYGALGVSFTYLAWLYVWASFFSSPPWSAGGRHGHRRHRRVDPRRLGAAGLTRARHGPRRLQRLKAGRWFGRPLIRPGPGRDTTQPKLRVMP